MEYHELEQPCRQVDGADRHLDVPPPAVRERERRLERFGRGRGEPPREAGLFVGGDELEEEAPPDEPLGRGLREPERRVVGVDDEAVPERHERLPGVGERVHEGRPLEELRVPPRLLAPAMERLSDLRGECPEEVGVGAVVLGAARSPDDEDAEIATEGSAEPRGSGDAGGREPPGGALLLPGGGAQADRHSVGQDAPGDRPEGLPHVLPEGFGRRVEEVDARRDGVEADDGEALRGEETGEEGVGHGKELGRSR